MAGLTVVLIGTIAMSVLAYTVPSDAPDAKIVIRQARGNDAVLKGNEIVLGHKGGDTLRSDSVKIIIIGEGKEALKIGGDGGIGNATLGEITITYNTLERYNYVESGTRKDRYFLGYDDEDYAKIVLNDEWTPGSKVVLYGADGASSNNNNNVDKKYELTPGFRVTVTIIDIPTNRIISSSSTTVK
ncbi:MAG: type IV pilin N-terminal domain-containing protein, partial [Candidatus Methanoperedens sp.]